MPHDAVQISHIAYAFLIAANRCSEQRLLPAGGYEMPLVPVITNLAFSTELSLKAIINIETTKDVRGHDLYTLFSKLSQASQIMMAEMLHEQDVSTVTQKLQTMSRAFEEWRYIYEIKTAMSLDDSFLRKFANSAYELLATKLP